MLKSSLKKLFSVLGYNVVAHGTASRLVLNDTLMFLVRDRNIKLIIDVGANKGQFRDFLRNEIRYTGNIISFEPNPVDFEFCKQRSKLDEEWEVFPWALGSKSATLPLNIMKSSVFSSFHLPRGDVVNFDSNRVEQTVNVPVRTLDDVIEELGLDATDAYLKCDTQGHDLEVLRGATLMLSRLAAFQSELSLLPIYKGTPTMLTALGEMIDYGYRVAAMAPVSMHAGAVIEYDCVMVRPR